MDATSELERRLSIWRSLMVEGLDDLEPQYLRERRVYGGAQGIWVDKTQTAGDELGLDGATVAILHTGRHYADDLSEDGVIYHYPKTSRPPARDAAEIQATKNAMNHKLPIFVVLPGKSSQARRSVRLGWVCDFDDDNHQFLILFGSEQEPLYSPPEADEASFKLTDERRRRASIVMARLGQPRFKFQVLAKYGCKCAVCEIRHPQLLVAAHIRGKSEHGSDDWRNGIPLCATHHTAFDCHLFAIEPASGSLQCKVGIDPIDIGLKEARLRPLKNMPHPEALRWRWDATHKAWNESESG